jgi:hypothetical protein
MFVGNPVNEREEDVKAGLKGRVIFAESFHNEDCFLGDDPCGANNNDKDKDRESKDDAGGDIHYEAL